MQIRPKSKNSKTNSSLNNKKMKFMRNLIKQSKKLAVKILSQQLNTLPKNIWLRNNKYQY